MSKTHRAIVAVGNIPDDFYAAEFGITYDDSDDWVDNDDPYTQECTSCHNELPDDDMTQCRHCDGWYCSDGCYEAHYERATGRRYGR